MVHENLRKLRKAKGVSQSFLAKKLGVSNMTYSRLENGETRIDVERLNTIAKALDVNVEIFFNQKLTDSVVYKYKEIKTG